MDDKNDLAFFKAYEVELQDGGEEKKLEKMQELNPELSNDYYGYYLIVSGKFALCPGAFFEPDKKQTIFSYQHKLHNNEELHHHYFPTLEAYSIFAMDRAFFSLYSRKFPGIQPLPLEACVVERLLKEPPQKSGPFMYLHVEESNITLAAFREQQLLSINTFQWQEKEDLLYYILFTAKQTGLKPEEDHFYFSGNIAKNDPVYRWIFQYLNNLFLIQELSWPQKVKEQQEIFHRYFKTFSSLQCV